MIIYLQNIKLLLLFIFVRVKPKQQIKSMFANAYQNASTLQVFDAKVNVDKNIFYKQLFKINSVNNHKQFDKEVKSYLYNILGQNIKMILPADDKNLLSLHQRYLILHIFIPIGFAWTLEFTMMDLNGIKRRINITTSQGKQQIKYFSFRYPLQNLKKGVWLFLGIDVYSFMNVFKSQIFRSLDQIIVGGNCRLRRIFTMKEFVQWQIPKNFWLSNEIPQEFQLIQYDQNQTKLQLQLSKQLTQPKSPKNNKKIQISPQIKNQNKSKHKDRIINNKSSILQDAKEQTISKKFPQQIMKSNIIQNAKNRLQYLQKEEQRIINQSKQLNPSQKTAKNKNNQNSQIVSIKSNELLSSIKSSKRKEKLNENKQKSSSQKMKMEGQLMPIQSKSKILPKINKRPIIQKAFKEDITVEIDEDQSSNFTQQHMKTHHRQTLATPYGLENKQQIIQQDRWSQQEKMSRPISQAISNLTGNFPSTIITKQNNKEIVINKSSGGTQIQLIYDQMVGCYYHPETNSYYQINH